MEQSRGRFTLEDVDTAARTLGFGSYNVLGVDYDDEIPDDFVESAWRDSVKRSWRDPEHGSEVQGLANEAFRMLAETRGSIKLRKTWEAGKNNMNPDQAYNIKHLKERLYPSTIPVPDVQPLASTSATSSISVNFPLALYGEGPKLSISTFCDMFCLSKDILERFQEHKISGTHAFAHISNKDLENMKFTIGELIDLKEAIKGWAISE